MLPSISKIVRWRAVRPTFSRSLCLPPARTHFCDEVARGWGRRDCPVKTSLNCTMPTFVNSRVGSFEGTSDELATSSCPRALKKPRNWRRTAGESEAGEDDMGRKRLAVPAVAVSSPPGPRPPGRRAWRLDVVAVVEVQLAELLDRRARGGGPPRADRGIDRVLAPLDTALMQGQVLGTGGLGQRVLVLHQLAVQQIHQRLIKADHAVGLAAALDGGQDLARPRRGGRRRPRARGGGRGRGGRD